MTAGVLEVSAASLRSGLRLPHAPVQLRQLLHQGLLLLRLVCAAGLEVHEEARRQLAGAAWQAAWVCGHDSESRARQKILGNSHIGDVGRLAELDLARGAVLGLQVVGDVVGRDLRHVD